jgi:hypothetical protein
MTVKFDFSAQKVTPETTKEYVFDMIPGEPSLILAPAHDSNPAYLDERLRMSIEASEKAVRDATGKRAEKLNIDTMKAQIEEDRDIDRRLLAKTCARGWGRTPKAADGSEPPFSEENCLSFFRALPDYMFDPLRNYAQNLYNFVTRPPISDGEARQLGN